MGLLLGLSIVLAAAAPASTPAPGAPVPPGSWVRVTHWDCVGGGRPWAGPVEDPAVCPAFQTQGRVISADGEQLSLRRRSQEYVVSLASERLVRLEVRTGRSPARGAVKGLKWGVLVGLGAALLYCGEGCGDTGREALRQFGVVVGVTAAAGTTLGLLFGGTQWEGVPLDRRSTRSETLRPGARRPLALALALRFSF